MLNDEGTAPTSGQDTHAGRKIWRTPTFVELPFAETSGTKSTSPDSSTGDYYGSSHS